MKTRFAPRIRIRPFRLSDAPFITNLLNDPDFIRHIGDRKVRTIADARRYLALGPMASHAQHGFGLDCVELLSSGESIGMCGLSKRPSLDDPDVGYAFLSNFRRQGLATEAVGMVLQDVQVRLGLTRFAAVVQDGNDASIKVLERCGFVLSGRVCLQESAPELLHFVRSMSVSVECC